jgi:phospholipase/lecithinase/hemolysin
MSYTLSPMISLKKRFPISIRILALLFTLSLCRSAWGYSELIIFGDSLSDTGNVASATTDFPWPYYDNRVSDGPLAVDVLASAYGLSAEPSLHLVSSGGGSNFAVDGASASGIDAHDLQIQLESHLGRHVGQIVKDALYVVMIGGNDLRAARNNGSEVDAYPIVDGAVAKISATLSTLLQLGVTKILVVNAPDIGRIPETLQKSQQDPSIKARSTALTNRFNTNLASIVRSLRSQYGTAIVEFDLFTYFNQILDNSLIYGFTNDDEGCFDANNYSFHSDCLYGQSFDRFVFFDSIHPTAKTHKLIGEAMVIAVQQNAQKKANIAPLLMLLLN